MRSYRNILLILSMLLSPALCLAGVNIDWYDSPAGGGCTGTYGRDSGTSTNQAKVYGIILTKVTLDCDGTVQDIESRFHTADTSGREVILGIYSDSAGEPSARLYMSTPVYNAATAGGVVDWVTASGVSLSLVAGDYWIGFVTEIDTTYIEYTLTSGDVRSFTNTSFTLPLTWDTATDATSTAARTTRMVF